MAYTDAAPASAPTHMAAYVSSAYCTTGSGYLGFHDMNGIVDSSPYVEAIPIHICGEPFYVEVEEGTYYIRHDKWSLLGAGDSLLEAEQDLAVEAGDLLVVSHKGLDVNKVNT